MQKAATDKLERMLYSTQTRLLIIYTLRYTVFLVLVITTTLSLSVSYYNYYNLDLFVFYRSIGLPKIYRKKLGC